MRIVFLGTPEFAVPSLRAIASSGHELAAVLTQPDRPKGRGKELAQSPVKIAAYELGIPVHQPERVRRPEAVELLKSLAPDLMVVVGYGQIIPQALIDLPKYGILNVHGSLLPKYRGAAPIQWAIANGEQETGVTIMQIDAGLDTGDMLAKHATEIGSEETSPELSVRLAQHGAELLIETLAHVEAGSAKRERQDDSQATYAPILRKEDGRVDWHWPAQQVYNRLRGFTPWPGTFTEFRKQPLAITRARVVPGCSMQSGQLMTDGRSLVAGCGGNSSLELLELQPSGKRRMSVQEFINGYRPQNGEQLGEGTA